MNKIKHMKIISSMLLLGGLLLLSCTAKDNKNENIAINAIEEAITEVDTMILRKGKFHKQLLCNGKLVAIRKSSLAVPSQGGLLEKVCVQNGSRVQTGDLLAVTDQRDCLRELEKSKHDLERAKVDLQDKLIGMGYDGTLIDVPEDIMHRVEVTSGYYSAKYQLRAAEIALEDCKLKAPFSGIIADLEARPFQHGDRFCTLIDNSFFDVEFNILETELTTVAQGSHVVVSPFVSESITLSGTVTSINPTVNANGLIKVKARIKNCDNRLIDGMNAKVVVEHSVPDVFVVPKSTVVERDGYHVVFLYSEGHAVWTYVDVTHANLTQYVINGCKLKETTIKEGDILITSGNLNLADDTEVKAIDY